MKMHEIRELIRLVDQSQITEFEFQYEDVKVSIKKSGKMEQRESVQVQSLSDIQRDETPVSVQAEPVESPPTDTVPTPTQPSEEVEANSTALHKIVSPMVGTFYRAPAPDAEPYVKVGDKVTETTVVCIVEAMKLMNEIEAEVKGEIVEILVENGQLVEYGQPLFLVKPE